ncbi:MAG: hypothetical protein ACYDGL_01725 [Bellilinea sp.]
MRKTGAIVCIILTLTLVACAPANSSGSPVNVTLDNQTSMDICEVYVSAEASNEWGKNLLADYTPLAPGESRLFEMNPGPYDLLVRNCEGVTVLSIAKFSSDIALTIGGSGTVPLQVENASTAEICFIYIVSQNNEGWGEDQLGSVESILPGEGRIFFLDPNAYRLRAEDCDHNPLQETGAFDLTSGSTWIVGNS